MTGTEENGTTQARADKTALASTFASDDSDPPDSVDRWTLIRDVVAFQGKLVLDGLRDLLLSPLSIAAAILALATGGDKPGRQFYDLLYLGRRSEHWINLFGATRHVKPPAFHTDEGNNIDALIDRLDEVARTKYEQGGLTQNAKDAVDKALDAVNRGLKNRGPDEPTKPQ